MRLSLNPKLPAMLVFIALATLGTRGLAGDAAVKIVLIGDSYLASFGVEPGKSFGVQLQTALDAAKVAVHIVDTGYTETSVSGARRIDERMSEPNGLGAAGPKAVILELGQNDCGAHPLLDTSASLDRLLARLAEGGIPVLVVGTTPYDHCERKTRPNYNALYVQMFADLAEKYGDLYYRDFKDGVNGHPELMQGDHDHPTAEGDTVIVARMLPVVQELVARATQP